MHGIISLYEGTPVQLFSRSPQTTLKPHTQFKHSCRCVTLYTNIRTKGAHHILTEVAPRTGSCGIEGRSPLFDRSVVALSFTLPPEYKLSGVTEKWILKRAAADLLHSTIVHRLKSGMRVPVQHWLRGPLREPAGDLLLGPRAHGIIRTEPIREWMEGRGSLWPRHGAKLWLVGLITALLKGPPPATEACGASRGQFRGVMATLSADFAYLGNAGEPTTHEIDGLGAS